MKAGADGELTYTDGGGTHGLTFEFACPVTRWNRVKSPVAGFETKSGDQPWRVGKTDRIGHPLQIRFAVEPAAVRPQTAPGSAPASGDINYVAIARELLARYDEDRGKVLCDARMIASDRRPLIDTTLERGPEPRRVRLKYPPKHLMSPDVYSFDDPTSGLVHFVFISPNGPMAPPVFGGFLFLPRPGMPSLHLVTFNVARLEASDRTQCGNAHHAEWQVERWINEQPPQWRNRVECLTLANWSRKGDVAYSPCNHCCHDLAVFLDGLNRGRSGKVAAALSWKDLYNKAAICGHPTDKVGIKYLKESGWKLSGPVPRGVDRTEGQTAKPGETPCLSPERPEERVLITA